MPRRVVRVSPRVAEHAPVLEQGVAAIRADLAVTPEFPAAVVEEAEVAARSPRLPELDRTDIPFVTIDPPTSQDLDQALHLERRGSGFRVHYAIADVAAFLTPGGAIDEEANRRGETLYGVGGKIPLHPKKLSEGACSLLPDGDRPALLWSIDVDESGEGVAVRVERAMVRSRAKLSYEGVQADLDADRADPVFGLLREVGELRLAREAARGGVSLPLPDQEVDLEDGHWVLAFRQPLPVETWNAQISLLTGMAAAHLMTEGKVGILRTLTPADPRDVAKLRRIGAALRVEWPEKMSYPDFIRSLDPARADHAAVLTSSTMLLRGSGYVSFDGELPEQPLHSALASTYAHVTAPLRRLVDRYAGEICLALCAGTSVPEWVLARLEELPATMRESSRRANQYERDVVDLVEAAVLANQVGQQFPAMVVAVDEKDPTEGEVMVTAPAVEARVHSGGPLPLGTEVQVTLVEADPVARKVRFQL
ncbi:MAG TPA: RNB domain-containing ribonuclease [Marmoricola sp.]|nr:RNB domain-containing ribonuclease [Marmoricola sp.]